MTSPDTPDTPTTAASDDVLDRLILATAGDDWLKVAVFIARVMDGAKAGGIETSAQAIAPRIYALADAGKLATQGNVRRWRAGEVKAVMA